VSDRERETGELGEHNVRAVRTGHGANCSSVGSVIDTLFATAVVGSAVFAAVLAALKKEAPTVVGGMGGAGTGAGESTAAKAPPGEGS
jgi:hypothetical protein